jgi:hypothetical protein
MKWPDPLSKQSEELVENYPLTKEELRLIVVFWAAVHEDTWAFCRLCNSTGSTDGWIGEYTATRLKRIREIIGEDEWESAYQEGEELVRQKIGNEFWTAYREGRPLIQEQIEAEYDEPELTKRETPEE